METIDIIDVTLIEPRLKHPTIFQKFDVLNNGESFIIENDHDPKPLYYQLLAEKGNVFTWQYFENGPQRWKVKISKTKIGGYDDTIGDIVSKDFRKAEIFKKYGLDFCCGGKKPLIKACQEKGLDLLQIEKELKQIEEEAHFIPEDFSKWELDTLTDYIINTHHKYVLQNSPIIFEYTQKVAKVHGIKHPEIIEINGIFLEIVDGLNRHMIKEENVLFPYIKNLASDKKNEIVTNNPPFITIQNPIRMMEMEHEQVRDLLNRIHKLSNNYTPPIDACTTFRLSYAKLNEFEKDLHQHIHLENNILFPQAIKLEKELLNN